MTDRLSIYNGALLMTGNRRLANLTENVESRYILDDIWQNGGGVKHCLEQAFWNHALRTVLVEYSPSIETPWGYRRAFDKPSDLVRIYTICTDEYFKNPLHEYQDEGNFWYADYDELYLRYVSNGDDYGMDMSLWPESFSRYVEGYFAVRAIKRLTDAGEDYKDLRDIVRRLLTDAKAKDAQKDPVGYAPMTGWQESRFGNQRRRPPYR